MLAIVGALATLVGVLLGGAIRAWETSRERKLDADSLLSALVAEIEAITRLIHHRQFAQFMRETQIKAQAQIENGQGANDAEFIVISLKKNYFSTYESSLPKIGLLHPYWADRITRFYIFLKAVTENYDLDSPFQNGVSAFVVDQIISNDLMILHTLVELGNHISRESRTIAPPKGISNPFGEGMAIEGQPHVPPPPEYQSH